MAFQSVNWWGYAQLPMSARPWQTQQLWDWSSCCSGDITKNFFFGLISTLFGYTVGTCIWLRGGGGGCVPRSAGGAEA